MADVTDEQARDASRLLGQIFAQAAVVYAATQIMIARLQTDPTWTPSSSPVLIERCAKDAIELVKRCTTERQP